jgi:hypothetical protein
MVRIRKLKKDRQHNDQKEKGSTDNTMAKRKRNNRPTTIYKTQKTKKGLKTLNG